MSEKKFIEIERLFAIHEAIRNNLYKFSIPVGVLFYFVTFVTFVTDKTLQISKLRKMLQLQ